MKIKDSILFAYLLITISTLTLNAQDKKEKDREAILSMRGCYKVEFNFSETFNYSKDTGYIPSKKKIADALEWVEVVEDSDKKIILQHILVVGESPKVHIQKHWRQDWLYENTDFYMYDVQKKWNFVKKSEDEVKGQWTQKVFQVDDSPRYEGSATWVYVDGKTYWRNTTEAPLPRREHTKRKDYNVTLRRNHHEIIKGFGWIHDQYNDKIVRKEGEKDFVLAQEKGYNTYKKIDDNPCKPAIDWWNANKQLWKHVRNAWDNVFDRKKNLELKSKVDGKRIFQSLFSLDPNTGATKVQKIVNSYIK